MQVYVYKLPDLPGSTRGYAATSSPLQPSSSTHNPAFGSGGLAATDGAEVIYVGSPVAPQPTSTLASLYGNASVYVYSVRMLPALPLVFFFPAMLSCLDPVHPIHPGHRALCSCGRLCICWS